MAHIIRIITQNTAIVGIIITILLLFLSCIFGTGLKVKVLFGRSWGNNVVISCALEELFSCIRDKLLVIRLVEIYGVLSPLFILDSVLEFKSYWVEAMLVVLGSVYFIVESTLSGNLLGCINRDGMKRHTA
jgi:ABC-type arginine/histidine transport system permease subunit